MDVKILSYDKFQQNLVDQQLCPFIGSGQSLWFPDSEGKW